VIIKCIEYTDYKAFIEARIKSESVAIRGLRQKIAKFIGCQSSYFSQVVNGKAHFTLEQAHRLCSFLNLDDNETKYFMLMVEYARSGTRDLKEYYMKQMEEIREARGNLKKRLKDTQTFSRAEQDRYYSTWFYSAIHVMLSIPEFQNIAKIAVHLNLPEKIVSEAIEFLVKIGIIEKKDGKYVPSKRDIHLERESEFIQRHHINWRTQCLLSVEKNLPDDLHYSVVTAIAKSDVKKIKEILIQSIEKAREVIAPSPEETTCVLALDFFKL
jgi:uncharacterized protein (TIGR02147 family)